jgi:hypothetical protein
MLREADFYTPGEAAKLLGLAEMTVLGLLTSGQLEGQQDERARWWIPSSAIDAAQRSRESSDSTNLSIEETLPIEPISSGDTTATTAAETPDDGEDVPNLIEVVQDLQYQLGRAEAQIELTARNESTLREQLAREQERADRLEAKLRETRRSTPEPRDAPETASEGAVNTVPVPPELQETVERRSWWGGWFGRG